MSEITLELHDLKSTVRGEEVPTAVVLPSGYEDQKEPPHGSHKDELSFHLTEGS